MTAKGVGFVGMRTDRLEETIDFFEIVIGIPLTRRSGDFAAFTLADGALLELFGPGSRLHGVFTTGPSSEVGREPLRLAVPVTVPAGRQIHGSRLEKRADMRRSTLREFVAGGGLRLMIAFQRVRPKSVAGLHMNSDLRSSVARTPISA